MQTRISGRNIFIVHENGKSSIQLHGDSIRPVKEKWKPIESTPSSSIILDTDTLNFFLLRNEYSKVQNFPGMN